MCVINPIGRNLKRIMSSGLKCLSPHTPLVISYLFSIVEVWGGGTQTFVIGIKSTILCQFTYAQFGIFSKIRFFFIARKKFNNYTHSRSHFSIFSHTLKSHFQRHFNLPTLIIIFHIQSLIHNFFKLTMLNNIYSLHTSLNPKIHHIEQQ